MQQIALNGGGPPLRIARAGSTLHIVNDPLLLIARSIALNTPESSSSIINRMGISVLLVGFDRVPSIDSYDMAIPPFVDACFAVPDSVSNVYLGLSAATYDGGHPFFVGGGASNTFLVEWPDYGEPFFRRIEQSVLGGAGIGQILASDFQGGLWQPAPQTPLLDQQLYGAPSFPAFMRPKLAPSVVDTIHQVTAANTKFAFAGLKGVLTAPAVLDPKDTRFSVCHRIIVSVSVACLFVIGAPNLAVGSPGVGELGRLAFAAAGTQTLEFGEGIMVQQSFGGGTWQAYTSVIATVDATVIGG